MNPRTRDLLEACAAGAVLGVMTFLFLLVGA